MCKAIVRLLGESSILAYEKLQNHRGFESPSQIDMIKYSGLKYGSCTLAETMGFVIKKIGGVMM